MGRPGWMHGRADDDLFTQALAEAWGSTLRLQRQRRGLSQRDLARRADVTQQTVSKLESGAMVASDRIKYRLACALDTDVATLFDWPASARSR